MSTSLIIFWEYFTPVEALKPSSLQKKMSQFQSPATILLIHTTEKIHTLYGYGALLS